MKVNIEIDLTPEEARALAGLPNYSQMHEMWLNTLKGKVENSAQIADIEPMLKAWGSLGGIAQDAFSNFFTTALKAATTTTDLNASDKK